VTNQHFALRADAPQGLEHGLAGIGGSGENFYNLKPAILKINAVGERAPGVDRYAHTDPVRVTQVALGSFKAEPLR
jgi:hypothetical protein